MKSLVLMLLLGLVTQEANTQNFERNYVSGSRFNNDQDRFDNDYFDNDRDRFFDGHDAGSRGSFLGDRYGSQFNRGRYPTRGQYSFNTGSSSRFIGRGSQYRGQNGLHSSTRNIYMTRPRFSSDTIGSSTNTRNWIYNRVYSPLNMRYRYTSVGPRTFISSGSSALAYGRRVPTFTYVGNEDSFEFFDDRKKRESLATVKDTTA